ncbi:KICSTOR complex protein SZT2-like [Neocloeon triangulifer]|uniref:KICSTOR complex protein SZT2-like n=1 Tax=Neocloeon triangulifer TaxID=2078957 RepID=UPI00286EE960|nr:KICSTOR complex protein SZT2-like [Neocloeon triangulifer]
MAADEAPDDETGAHHEPLNADQVYILMKKDYRISRNVRAQWFIEHLNRFVSLDSNKENDDSIKKELTILSIVPSDPPKAWSVDNSHLFKYFITPATRVIFLAEKYRMVYCLDISPSLSAVDIQMGEVMLDCLVSSVKASLEGVSQKFIIPGSTKVFQPDVYATIIAHTPFFTSPAQQVLVQGWQVTQQNLPQLLTILEQQLQELEGKVAEVSGIAQAQLDALRAESERLVGGLFEETLQPITSENPMVSPDTGFINMLRFGMLALKLLPDSSSANIIVVTDGIINIPDVNIFDSVLSQLRSSTVCCSFIQVAGSFHPNCCKGFVPYSELMQLLASATQGAYITAAHKLEISKESTMNVFHEAFLTWSFQHSVKEFSPKTEVRRPLDWAKNYLMSNEIKDRMLIRKKQVEDTLNARLTDVLSCRLREGYIIKSLSPKDSSSIEVCLVLPWKNDIYIEYLVTSQLPPTNSVHYVVTIEAPYEFLHDITCLLKKPFKSHFRQAVVGRFWHTLKNLTHTDQLLVHLHSFGSNSSSYMLPDSIKSGMPLFYLPNNSTPPALLSSESSYPQFANYWKPICLLDAAVWQKWLHAHRLGLLLQHDFPLPRYLHQANQSGRFQQVQCRQAAAVLFSTLKAWSSFVLIENHTYVKLIQNENEKVPSSFLLMRVTSKLPCVVINLAFLGGASGCLRHQILSELKAKMRSLTFPQRPLGKETIIRKFSTVKNNSASPEEQKAVITWSDLNCCILLVKPVEKILIRYERMPSDFATVVFPDGTQPIGKPGIAVPVVPASGGSSMLTTLSRYLHHRRWIWVAQPGQKGAPPNSVSSLTRTLSTITKTRLQEGFTFAHSTAGIINMLLEVTMQAGFDTHPCVVQYVLFPPHQVTNKDSNSDEECTEEVDPTEPEGELQIITECWIEPQYGHIINSPAERAYMDGLSYDQLADEICKVDAECISSLLTFEHLSVIGNEKVPTNLPPSTPIDKFIQNGHNKSYNASVKMLPEQRINVMPFTFNLINLLPKCQQAEMLFSSFIQDLAWSFPMNYEAFSYLDTANNMLLQMAYDSLLKCHDCELFLSHMDSKMFLDFLRQKERSKSAYPSPIPQQISSEEQGKMSPAGYDVFNDVHLCDKFLANLKMCKYPKWKCYLKRVNNSHLLLTFVPASFADLKLLMLSQMTMDGQAPQSVKCFSHLSNVNEQDRHSVFDEGAELKDSLERLENLSIPESHSVPEMCEPLLEGRPPPLAIAPFRERAYSLDAEQRKRSLMEFRKRTRTCSMDSRHKKKFSLQPLSPPQLEELGSNPKLPVIPPNHKPQFGAITLPVFTYDCPLATLIEVLVYKESEKKAGDIYEDHTCSSGGENGIDEHKTNKEVLDVEGIELGRMHLASPEPKSEDSDLSREINSLKQQCKLVKASFHRSYVTSLFKSLQLGSFIYAEDVQSAVRDCDETSVEIDLTKFLKAVCGHLKEFWVTRRLDLFKPPSKVAGNDLFSLANLHQNDLCGRLKTKHIVVKEQFSSILSDFFKAVPSNPRFFFSIPKWERDQQVENSITENEQLADQEDVNSNYSHDFNSRRGSHSWEVGGDDTHTSDSVSDLPEEEVSSELCPLFLQLVCSVHHSHGVTRHPISSLPTCLAEIGSLMTSDENEISVSSLRVHLDVQCLTILPNLEPCTSQLALKQTPPDQVYEQIQNAANSTLNTSVSSSSSLETELKSEEVSLKLSHLPDYLQKAMISTMNKIKWLLQDELASSLLDVFPPSESTLQMVAQHVMSSVDRINCSMEKIDLHFVFGADHSLNKFIENFVTLRIGCYFLRKEGKYYHLVQDRTARQHKMQSTPVNGPHFKSIATPSSLAEDSSEMSIYQNEGINIPQSHYSESDIQALGLDSTPTDEPLSRPLSDLKLPAALELSKMVEKLKKERKTSADLLTTAERKHKPPSSLWLDTCSSSAPTASFDVNKEILSNVMISEGIDHENLEALWDMRVKSMSRPGSNKTPGNQRTRNFSGAISTTGPNSETSSFIEESAQGTEEGYDGDSSEDNNSQSDDYLSGWGNEEFSGVALPNFWLVMEVTSDHVITYFHCRNQGKEISKFREVRNKVIASILETCKLVNQIALLQNLHDTKNCDDLLEADLTKDNWESSKSRSSSFKDDQEQSQSIFKPGAFSCNVVWETQFVLHPRLKTGGPAKRGIQALESVLSRFPVINRKNMFVYQDNLQNVFYLRLQEPALSLVGSKMTPSSSSNQGIFLTDGEMTPPGTSFARSPSISSLKRDDSSRIEVRPRVKSYGERDMPLDGFSPTPSSKNEEAVVLKVHGIAEAGSAIKEDLVQVLHNRLNDAVLELLCAMLFRNPMCKLTPDDVHFIQKPYKQADMSIDFSIQPFAMENHQALVYYLKQNLLEFLYTPKYTDSKAENHFQDYTHDFFSKDRVPEDDIFLYNQNRTSGNKGIACIAVAIVDSNGCLLKPDKFTKPNCQAHVDSIINMDFINITSTQMCNAGDKTARVEFRIWKQGKVNSDLLTKNLQMALQHTFWDLQMEYRLLTPSLSQDDGDMSLSQLDAMTSSSDMPIMLTSFLAGSPVSAKSLFPPESIDQFESGEKGRLHQVFHWVMTEWLSFAVEIGVPSVKKHTVHFKSRQDIALTLKEFQKIIMANAPDSSVAIFQLSRDENHDIFIPYQPVSAFSAGSRWDKADTSTSCLLFGRNLQQWKACVSDNGSADPDILSPKAQKVLQKFAPLFVPCPEGLQFVPRQRLLLANLSNKEIVIFTYNWSKDRAENMHRQITNLGNWLAAKSSLTTTIVCQKMGLFHNMMFNRQAQEAKKGSADTTKLTFKDVEQLIKPPAVTQKDFSMGGGRRPSLLPNAMIHDVFRDNKPSRLLRQNSDPVTANGQHLLELFSMEKKDSQKKLYQLWETRVTTPNIPVSEDLLQLLKQHSRVIHFCLTPLLYLPSWRLQAAATRDHTLASNVPLKSQQEMAKSYALAPPSRHESGNSLKSNDAGKSTKSNSSPQMSPKFKQISEEKWHSKLCQSLIDEYKHYLTTLGFVPIQTEAPSPKKSMKNISKDERQRKLSGSSIMSTSSFKRVREDNTTRHFLQKSLLGGILIFEISLNEPFIQAKLYALECSRLQAKSSGLISHNQFTFSFLDESDKIKILMHLHSFTYDYHLRCIHNYITNQHSMLKQNFHLRNFLDDFIKYYSKGPNYARNLVYGDAVRVTETTMPALQLFNFLWTHEDLYKMEVFCMSPENEFTTDNEYVLIQLKSTHPVMYKDNHDVKQTDDFDVTLIISHAQMDDEPQNPFALNLKYYILLTSRREHFPKHIVERKLGKFCTVPLATPPQFSLLGSTSNPSFEEQELEEEDEPDFEGSSELDESKILMASSQQQSAEMQLLFPHLEIKQENVNYMGYYSSHEQLMQQLMMQQANEAKEQVLGIVHQGLTCFGRRCSTTLPQKRNPRKKT